MKKLLIIFLILIPVKSWASTAVYDDATQTLTNKTIDCNQNTLTNCAGTGTVTSYQTTFTDANLNASNQISITHSLNTTHYGSVVLFDNNNIPVSGYTLIPVDADSATLDMIGFGTIPGTWTIEILSGD